MTHYNELAQMIEDEVEYDRAQNLADALFAEYQIEAAPEFVNTGLQVGDIYASSWGYDQTNVNFYQVLKVTPKTVTVQEIYGETHEVSNRFCGTVMPVKDSFVTYSKPMRRTVRVWNGVAGISIDSSENAYNWNGKPQNVTSYA